MRKLVLILLLMTIHLSFVLGQTPGDTISVFKMNRGYQYFKGDKQLTADEIAFAVRSNDQAYHMVRSAQSNHTFATILAYAGGFMIGWQLGAAIVGDDPSLLVAGAGIAVAGLGFSVGTRSETLMRQGVELYNEGLGAITLKDPRRMKTELRFSFSEYGLGLAFRF